MRWVRLCVMALLLTLATAYYRSVADDGSSSEPISSLKPTVDYQRSILENPLMSSEARARFLQEGNSSSAASIQKDQSNQSGGSEVGERKALEIQQEGRHNEITKYQTDPVSQTVGPQSGVNDTKTIDQISPIDQNVLIEQVPYTKAPPIP